MILLTYIDNSNVINQKQPYKFFLQNRNDEKNVAGV